MSDLDALFDNVSKSLIGILDKVVIHPKVHNTVRNRYIEYISRI